MSSLNMSPEMEWTGEGWEWGLGTVRSKLNEFQHVRGGGGGWPCTVRSTLNCEQKDIHDG